MKNLEKILKSIIKNTPKKVSSKLPQKIKIITVSSALSKNLNYIYRKKNKPTNVLSFYYDSSYGELLICREVIKKEAKKAGNPQKFQMTWMILHGILHLAGIHHEVSAKKEKEFESLEKEFLEKCCNR